MASLDTAGPGSGATIVRVATAVDRYIAAWTAGDRAGLGEVLSGEAVLEANLGRPERFLAVLERLAGLADVSVTQRVDSADGAMVVYDCAARTGGRQVRLVEYLTVAGDRIIRVRRVYDVVGVREVLPDLAAEAG